MRKNERVNAGYVGARMGSGFAELPSMLRFAGIKRRDKKSRKHPSSQSFAGIRKSKSTSAVSDHFNDLRTIERSGLLRRLAVVGGVSFICRDKQYGYLSP
jgi:hypothetical protein